MTLMAECYYSNVSTSHDPPVADLFPDFSAHSNYIELALIEMGERDVFPFVGRQTQIRLLGLQSPVYPVITGTFGGVDFLHSVMGEFDDKATQSEIQQLEETMQTGSRSDTSLLKNLLGQIPGGLLGDARRLDHRQTTFFGE